MLLKKRVTINIMQTKEYSIGIDSGTLLLIDPCYIYELVKECKSWEEFHSKFYSSDDLIRPIRFGYSQGIVIDTGGDGVLCFSITHEGNDLVDIGFTKDE